MLKKLYLVCYNFTHFSLSSQRSISALRHFNHLTLIALINFSFFLLLTFHQYEMSTSYHFIFFIKASTILSVVIFFILFLD